MTARWYLLFATVWLLAVYLLFTINNCSASTPC